MRKPKTTTTDSLAYRLYHAMVQRGFRNCDICDQAAKLGVKMGSSTISQYISGKYIPKQDKIILLSRILGVPQLWLMGVTPLEDMAGTSLQDFENPLESEVLRNFRSLNKEGKELAIRLLRTIADTREYRP